MATDNAQLLPESVISCVDTYYESSKLENKAMARVFEEFFSKNPYKDRQPFYDMFMKLCVILLSYCNYPDRREGALQKVEFLKNVLEAGGLEVKTDKHELDQGDVLCNVIATSKNKEDGPHGLMAFHHDTIKQENSLVKAEIVDGKLTHPWLLDDTIQVASGVLEVLRFACDPYRAGAVTILITDREEMNTQGMRKYLEKQYANGKLHPYSWIIAGESTGNTTGLDANIPELSELVIAVANRGKGVREVMAQVPSKVTVVEATKALIFRIRQAQMRAYVKSITMQDKSLPTSEQLVPTAIIPTVVVVDRIQAYAYLEFRTDENMTALKTAEIIDEIFCGDSPVIDYKNQFVRHDFDPKQMAVEVDPSSDVLISLTCGTNQHPGNYDPRTRTDAFSAIEYILMSLDAELCAQIEEITVGEKAKPNSVSCKAVIKFKTTASRDLLLENIKDTSSTPSKKTNFATVFSWIITRPDHIPDRETIRMSKNNRHIVKKVQETIAQNVARVFNKPIQSNEIPTGVFNAMHDGGAITVNQKWYEAIFPQRNVNMIVLGAGNFNMLHNPREPMSYNTLNLALCQYHNVINALNKEAV